MLFKYFSSVSIRDVCERPCRIFVFAVDFGLGLVQCKCVDLWSGLTYVHGGERQTHTIN